MMKIEERRSFAGDVEIRMIEGARVAVGYAAKFGVRSDDIGGFVEQIAPTAFTKTVTEADVRALRDHDPSRLLGRTGAGTLRLFGDSVGLRYEIDLPDTQEGRDTALLLERGDLFGSSFGFRTISDSWAQTETGFPLRTLTEVALRDVGPVTFPAYAATEAALRSLAGHAGCPFDEVVEAAGRNELRHLLSTPVRSDEAAVEAPLTVIRRNWRAR